MCWVDMVSRYGAYSGNNAVTKQQHGSQIIGRIGEVKQLMNFHQTRQTRY